MINLSVPVYIQVHANKIVIQRLDNMKSMERVSETPFSNERLIVADYEIATNLMQQMLKALFSDRMFFIPSPSLDICIQQISNFEGPITPFESRMLLDIAERCGGDNVVVEESQTELEPELAKKLLD
ncbi:MAG: hypothetical protein EP332_04280 [Bacteroidetes bacterium]|nr:MAG: hypothetical protein EP332_04280 [Bacteroidota bacterium]